MKTGLLLCCLVAVFSSGCMSTHELWGESPEAVAKNISKLQGEEVDLMLANGAFYEEVRFTSFGDSVAFRPQNSKVSTVVPFTSVVSVSRPGTAVGPIAGCLGGLFLGGALGASLAMDDHLSTKPKSAMDEFGIALTSPMAAAAGGMVGGLLGGTAGLIIGSLLGSGDRYVLDPGPDSGVLEERGERCIAAAVTASGDTVCLGVAGLISKSNEKITVRWHGAKIGLNRPPASIVRKGRNILVVAPAKAWD
jgi:hypothetical protein